MKIQEIVLKRCPFCGNARVRLVEYKPDGATTFTERYAVLCDYRDGGCGAESGHYKGYWETVEAWNRRRRKQRDEQV